MPRYRGCHPRCTRRALRWSVVFSVPALLLVSLLFVMQGSPSVDATSTNTYVDCSGGGQTPNFPTIQEAVSNTAPSGVVHICAGVYSESVNLALMNGGGAGNEGDITVVAEDGPGTAKIAPLVGPALYISITPFSGNITLEGLDVTSGDSEGINLSYIDSYVSGTLTISGVIAHDAAGQGVIVRAVHDISIINSQALSNGYGGFFLAALGDLTVKSSEANFNGTFIGIGTLASGFTIIDFAVPVPGSCTTPPFTIQFVESSANDNNGYGIEIAAFYHDVLFDAFNARRNALDGVHTFASGGCQLNVTVVDSAADENGVFLGDIPGLSGGFKLTSDRLIEVARSSAEGNENFGFCMDTVPGGLVMMDGSAAEDNGRDGVSVGRDCFGSPGAPGLAAHASAAISPVVVQITNTSAISNGTNGFLFDTGDLITVTNISALRNVSEGVELRFGTPVDSQLPSGVSMSWIADSLIMDNQGYGVEYELRSTEFQDFIPSPAPAAILSSTQFVNNSIICDNIRGGLAITEVVEIIMPPEAPSAPELFNVGPLEVNATANWWGDNSGPAHPSNSTPGTGDAVFDSSNGFTGTAYFNPWIDQIAGTATPNPTLLGIPVDVNFQFSGAAQSVFLGQGVGNLNDPPPFTLATDNGSLEGNNPASPIAAAVGTSITQFIGPANGLLPVVLTPSSAGQANVTLQGPCNLNVQVPVEVASLSISLLKTVGKLGASPSCPAPGTVTVEQGDVVEYCYTVTNTGDFTLSTHSLVDDKLGVLMTDQPFELGSGQSVSTLDLGLVITTSLNVTTTNTGTWTAAVDPAISANSASVTASNVASVNVPPAPTAIDPDDQPALPRRIFVPSLSR